MMIDFFVRGIRVRLFGPLVGVLLVFAAGGVSVYASVSEPGGEPGTGEMEFTVPAEGAGAEGGRRRLRGIHLGTDVSMRISGVVVEVSVTQRFRNPADRWVEGRYLFPLPENSAVYSMEMIIGERRITGEIREKEEARQIYQEARDSGVKTALIEQHRPNLFSQEVANIAPGETVAVTLQYRQSADYQNGTFRVYFPMTLTPRYMPQGQLTNRNARSISSPFIGVSNQKKDGNSHQDNTAALSITLDAGLPTAGIISPYHEIDVLGSGQHYRIAFAEERVIMNRDFVLEWEPVPDAQPQAAVFYETMDDEDYRMIMLMPPTMETESVPRMKRDIIFIIDTSGSMGGTSIEQAKAGLLFGLRQLGNEDRFNIIEFNSSFRSLFDLPGAADELHLQRAERFVQRLHAGGGTEMRPALNAAFNQLAAAQLPPGGSRSAALQQIVFITDGSVGNESELFEFLYKRSQDVRIHTAAIGSAPNRYFMRKAAQFGRGTYTQIGAIDEVQEVMSALFERISRPVMHSIKISAAGDAVQDMLPRRIPDLYYGEPLIIYIRDGESAVDGESAGAVLIEGLYGEQGWEQSLAVEDGWRHAGVAGLWAAEKIESLMDEIRTGSTDESLKDKVLAVALRHSLMSPYTSFVAFEEVQEVKRDPWEPLSREAVPNQLPHGSIIQMVPYPDTASNMMMNFLIGLVLLLLVPVLLKTRRAHG